jgi:hypothetical protein
LAFSIFAFALVLLLRLKENEILAIKRLHHFSSWLLDVSGGIDEFDDIRCVLMDDQLGDLLIDLRPKILFLFRLWSVVVGFLGQVVGVLLGHQLNDVLLDLIDHELFLFHAAVLDHGLDNPATVVLVNQLIKFFANCVNALLNQISFALVGLFEFLVLHEQLVVIAPQFFDQIGNLSFDSSVLRVCFFFFV